MLAPPVERCVYGHLHSSAIGTICMAFLANKPFVMAPGMGLNSFFAVICGNIAAMLKTDSHHGLSGCPVHHPGGGHRVQSGESVDHANTLYEEGIVFISYFIMIHGPRG